MFEVLLLAIAFIGGSAAGLWDLKTSDIPDKVVIAMIILGIVFNSFETVLSGDVSYIRNSLLAGLGFLAFGLLIYFLGQWGDGDAALFSAFGFLLPNVSFNYFINLFFVSAAYTIIYSLIFAYKENLYPAFFLKIKGNTKPISIIFLALLIIILPFAATNMIYVYVPVMAIGLYFVYRFLRFIEDSGFYRKINSKYLKVGDVIGEDIPKLKLYSKLIRGLTQTEINKIRKIKKHVYVRDGVRSGIVFPINLLITIIYGNVLLVIL